MARPKVCVSQFTIPSHTLPSAEGLQATATTPPPRTGSVNENDNQASGLKRPTTTHRPAVQVKTERNYSPALGEKLLPKKTVSATIPSNIPRTFPGAQGLQATAPAPWSSTRPAEENHGQGSERTSIFSVIQRLKRPPSTQGPALVVKTEQDRSPASASISTAAVVKVEGVNAGTCSVMPSSGDSEGVSVSKNRKGERKTSIVGKKRKARRITLSFADLVSDTDMRLKDKAVKLGVSQTTFKNRRRNLGLGRWPGRGVRAEIKRAQTQPPA